MLQSDSSIFWLTLAAAPFIGSFLGVLIVRLPQARPVAFGRSQCDSCGHALGPLDMVPLVSFLALRGRCRYCAASIVPLHPAIEIAAACVALWAATEISGWLLAATALFGWLLLALAVIDWRHYRLPDVLTLPLLLAGLAVSYALDPAGLPDRAIAVIAGFAAFAALGWVYRALRGREGLGLGDAKLLGALGAWVSWIGLPTVVLYAAMLGLLAVFAASLLGRKLEAAGRVPFGTFLALGGWLVWLYGPLLPG